MTLPDTRVEQRDIDSPLTVLLIFLRLGLTSFGGPVAHLGYFRDEFVARRRWLSEHSYADLIALSQFLPGPSSSQVGIAIGLSRAGYAGALAAWAGFTLPSAALMIAFALGLAEWGNTFPAGVLHGLKIAAAAIVAHAVWSMARNLCTDAARVGVAVVAAVAVLFIPGVWGQIGVIAGGAVVGLFAFKTRSAPEYDELLIAVSRRTGAVLIGLFFVLLAALPVLAHTLPSQWLALLQAFYRSASLVFGGGHVVLPLLQQVVVPQGWISNENFLAGYGAAQALPGPLFSFAAFIGASISGWTGAIVCLVGIFLPSFLLVIGVMPFWENLRRNIRARGALAGINAAVVGLLAAALYNPIWTGAVRVPLDAGLVLAALVAVMVFRLPAWLVVMICGAAGWLLDIL